jgi:hypothetical protein
LGIITDAFDKWICAGDQPRAPVTYSVPIEIELSYELQVFAAAQNVKPETIIAEAVRAYLGVDA